MDLSNDLISKFVKITNDGDKNKTKEGTVYGTITQFEGNMYVKIDGSDLLTPIDTTADIKEGERVTIMIKDHNATVTGNISSPSASSVDVKKVTQDVEDLGNQISEFEIVIADRVSTKQLDAEVARIDDLLAGKAEIEQLNAANAEITNLKAKDAEIDNLVAQKATIEQLNVTNAEITNLKAKDAEIDNLVAQKATIEQLNATNAEITNLKAKDAEIDNLVAAKASVDDLKAVQADIIMLEADKADVDVLNAAVANIETLTSDLAIIDQAIADKANIGDLNATNAQIADLQANKADITDLNAIQATIDGLDANFATIEQLNATNANVGTLDAEVADIQTLVNGNLTSDNIASLNLTSANTTIQNAMIKDAMIDSVTASKLTAGEIDTNEITIKSTDGSMILTGSIQQFKDENGTIRIQIGKDGEGNFTFVLYDETGNGVLIDESGIKSSNAIADGLIVDAKVADNANIAGSKLDIASVVTEVNNGTTTIKSNKIYIDDAQQTLDVAFNQMQTNVEANTESIQTNTTALSVQNGQINTLISENQSRQTEIANLSNNITGSTTEINNKYSALEQDLNNFKTTVGESYATKQSVTDVSNNLSANYSTTEAMNSAITQKANEITSSVSETYATKQSVTDVSNNLSANYSTTSAMNSAIQQKANEITQTVSETYATKQSVTDVSNNLSANYSTTEAMNSAITQKANEITSSVSETYATKQSVTDVSNNLSANYSTTEAMNSAITQKANEITSSVSETYATKQSVTDVSNNLSANYSTTSAMNSAIQQKANEITQTVSETYTSKSEFNNLQIGGTNLIQNGNFKGAIAGSTYMPAPWTFWGEYIHIYGFHGTPGYNHVGCVYIGCNLTDGRQAGMYSNRIHVSKVEKGATYMASFIFTMEPNVKGATAQLEYLNDASDQILHTQGLTTARVTTNVVNGLHEHQYHIPFTMWTGDFSYVQISFNHGGTNLINGGYLMIVGNVQIEKGNKATDWSPAPEDVQGQIDATNNNLVNNYSTTAAMNSAIQQKANEITQTVSETYATKQSVTDVNNNLSANYSTTEAMNSAIQQKANEITQTVSETYATKQSVTDVSNNLSANYSTTEAMNSAIQQKANEITQTVSETYATKQSVTDVSNNLSANYSTTEAMNSAITQKANEITQTVSETYTSKSEFNNLEVGGRNLLVGLYNDAVLFGSKGEYSYFDIWNWSLSGLTEQNYVISFEARADSPINVTCYFYEPSNTTYAESSTGQKSNAGDGAVEVTLTTEWKRYWVKWQHPGCEGHKHLLLGRNYTDTTAYIRRVKFEKGSKATDWSPAPEDVQGQIDATNNNLANNYSTTSQMNSTIQQKANEITSSVSQTYVTNYEAKKLADTTTTGLNKYLFERYRRDGFEYGNRPTLNDLVGARLIESQLVDNPPAHTSDLDSQYMGVLTFYLYYDYACTKTVTITTDDHGTVYLNNVGIYELSSCVSANVTFNMIKGLNRIDIIYAEGGGGDGVSWGGVDGWSAFGAYANVVTNEIANRTNELTLAMTQGNMLYTDPTFRTSQNGTFIYNNLGNGTVTVERIAAIEGCPNTSGQCLEIISRGNATPGLGGFAFGTYCRPNAVFITKITAKIPVGYRIGWASNDIGSGGEQKWLSTTSGTGDWHDYYCKVRCGSSGNFSSTNFFYLDGPGASAENPVIWYVSYATLFDVTDSDERVTNLTNNLAVNYSTTSQMNSAIQQKANEITSSVSETYATKQSVTDVSNNLTNNYSTTSQMNSAIQQKANEITSSVSETYATKQSVTDVSNNLANNYSTTSQMNSAIQQKANEITSSVSQTYTTKTEFNSLEVGGTNLVYNGGFNRYLDQWHCNGGSVAAQACTESPSGHMLYMEVTNHGHGVYQHFYFYDSTYCTDYVVSFYAKTNVDGSQMYVSMEGDPGTSSVFTLNGGWQKCVYKFRRSNPGANALVFYAQGNGARNIYIHSIKMEKGTVPSAWSPHPSEIENKVDNLSSNLTNNYSTTTQMNSAIQQKANEITSSVSQTYATKQSVTDLNNNLTNNYSTTTQMNSAIQQKANEITSSVSQTYATKQSLTNLNNNLSAMNDTVVGYQKWLFEQYTNNQNVGTGNGTFPTLAHLANETLITSRLVDYLPGYTSAISDYYIGVYTVYLYYESDYTWNGHIISDDESTTYLNGVAVCQAATCTQTTFTMNFKKGINKLQIIHGEGGGGDGVTLSDLGPWKEYGAYPACVAAASSNHYASNSDIIQTVNDLTIKFAESGGYNLLQNGHADKGTSYWIDNGGGLSLQSGAGGGATGNFFGTSLPSGIYYYDWVRLLPNTHYVYQAKVWSNTAFEGDAGVPLHFWFSYDGVNNTGDGYTILDYQQSVPHAGTWVQLYLHFVTGNSNIFFKPFIYTGGATISPFYVTELMLSQSRVVQPWSPHPSEVYSGITQIDKYGIRVHHSNANSYTHMAPDGFFVNNNGTDVVQVTASGLYVQGNITSGSTIQGARITGSTFNSSNDVFQVLEDGTIETSFLAVNGAVSTDKLNVNDIENASYPKVLSEATTVYISPNGGVNAEEFYDGAYFTSLSNMLAVAPRNLNGYTLTIRMAGDLYENAALTWFHSGQVNFEMQGYTLYGYFYGYGASMCYRLYGNTNANNSGAWGHIKPNTGRALGSYSYAVQFQYCQFAINNIAVYPSASSGSSSGGISAHRGATGIVFSAKACGDMRYLVRAEYAGRVHVNSSEGACNNATFCASTGGIITLNSSNDQAGRSTTGNPYWVGTGGIIAADQLLGMDKIKFKNAAQSGSSSSSGSTTRKVTETIKATSADTYRSTVYNNWKGDGTVRQGDYGHGDCQGCWFFGNNLYTTMNAGTVTKVVIRIQRQSGGVNALQTLTVKSHNHTSRPSGAPTYTDTIGTCSCAVGSYIDLVITDSTTINKLKNCKGLGLSIGSASSPYAVCSGACSVIITYTTTN